MEEIADPNKRQHYSFHNGSLNSESHSYVLSPVGICPFTTWKICPQKPEVGEDSNISLSLRIGSKYLKIPFSIYWLPKPLLYYLFLM